MGMCQSQTASVWIPPLSLYSRVALDNLFNLSLLQFTHL